MDLVNQQVTQEPREILGRKSPGSNFSISGLWFSAQLLRGRSFCSFSFRAVLLSMPFFSRPSRQKFLASGPAMSWFLL